MAAQALAVRQSSIAQVDSLDRYVAEISRYPLLSREEERELADRLKNTDDVEAAHRLVTSNLRFVVKIAHEYKGYGFRLLDLIQEGNVGLMIAVKKFEPTREYRLISYAVWWIRAYMQNFILRSWSLVKIGTTQAQRKLFYKLRGTQAALAKENAGRKVTADMVAAQLGVDVADVNEMDLRLSARDFSLDMERSEESKQTFLDVLPDEEANQEEDFAERERQGILEGQVAQALSSLNDKERFIVENRLMAEEPLTLREIGEKFKVSRERARQIEANVIKKVKKLLGPTAMAAFNPA